MARRREWVECHGSHVAAQRGATFVRVFLPRDIDTVSGHDGLEPRALRPVVCLERQGWKGGYVDGAFAVVTAAGQRKEAGQRRHRL